MDYGFVIARKGMMAVMRSQNQNGRKIMEYFASKSERRNRSDPKAIESRRRAF